MRTEKLVPRAAAGLIVAALVLPRLLSAQETQTNSPSDYFLQAVQQLVGILEPPTNKAPRTFTTTVKVTKAGGLPAGLVGREVNFAFQAPDHLRLSATWQRQNLVVCRDGQELWVYAPAEKFGLIGSPDQAPSATTPDGRGPATLGPLKLPFSVAQLGLLPFFADVQSLPGETVGATPCRVLKLTPKQEATDALNMSLGTLQLWLRESDSMPVRLAYADGKGTDVQVDWVNPQIQEAWPADRWKLKAGEGDRIMTAANYFDNYDPRAPLNVAVNETTEVNQPTPEQGHTITKFTFDGYKGEKIPALISLPMNGKGKKLPAIIFLHGMGQNKNFLKRITAPFNQAGFAFVCFDQYTTGERQLAGKQSYLDRLAAFMVRPAKTINETRRLVDYLLTRPDIDPQRLYLVGASYGAITGSTVLAKDKRLRAGVMVYGGGDFSKLLDSYANHLGVAVALGLIDGRNLNPAKPPLPKLTPSQEREVGMILGLVKPFASCFLGVADPIRYAGQISPRPVYFQNGTYDVLVPAAAGKALQEAAQEPKKITWYGSDHVGIDVAQTKQVLADGLKWLLEQDDAFRAPEEKGKALPAF